MVALSFAASSPVGAQYCEGTVHGLSRHYDLDTGSGFLAVRARPNSSSRMIGQLFNGDHTEFSTAGATGTRSKSADGPAGPTPTGCATTAVTETNDCGC
ncbi:MULTISPECIES: hypothetical protein [unclassified Mesorhizobium]|uniref:hypothetical protein n=1 Tax=unclassified Mesorhizobium TaxID=325217 RepID=UPI00333B23DB